MPAPRASAGTGTNGEGKRIGCDALVFQAVAVVVAANRAMGPFKRSNVQGPSRGRSSTLVSLPICPRRGYARAAVLP